MTDRTIPDHHTVILPALCWSRRQPDFHAVTQDISRSGIVFRSAVSPQIDQLLTCSIRYIGLLEARVTGTEENRFTVRVRASRQRSAEIAGTMMALAREQEPSLDTPRVHPRISPTRKDVLVTLVDGRILPGRLINISASGAALSLDYGLANGTPITIGGTAARVVRTFPDGIGAAFTFPLDPAQVHAGIQL
ncbi:pilus assembly protein PilZ [Methylorubrum populi]|uniref:Pilus assembly protein PilZ n=1 Tax=Methylobacterium radiotolerans TaxID=31998 RepID=A0ABU7TF71_9HYPH